MHYIALPSFKSLPVSSVFIAALSLNSFACGDSTVIDESVGSDTSRMETGAQLEQESDAKERARVVEGGFETDQPFQPDQQEKIVRSFVNWFIGLPSGNSLSDWHTASSSLVFRIGSYEYPDGEAMKDLAVKFFKVLPFLFPDVRMADLVEIECYRTPYHDSTSYRSGISNHQHRGRIGSVLMRASRYLLDPKHEGTWGTIESDIKKIDSLDRELGRTPTEASSHRSSREQEIERLYAIYPSYKNYSEIDGANFNEHITFHLAFVAVVTQADWFHVSNAPVHWNSMQKPGTAGRADAYAQLAEFNVATFESLRSR